MNLISIGIIIVLAFIIMKRKGGERLFNNIKVQDLKEKVKEKNVVVLDVRTAQELREGYIKGSKHIDFFSNDFKTKVDQLDKDKEYVVYCKSGNRSTQATKIMTAHLGFKNVNNVIGGMASLVREKYPLVK